MAKARLGERRRGSYTEAREREQPGRPAQTGAEFLCH
jgi:hypothetical protein